MKDRKLELTPCNAAQQLGECLFQAAYVDEFLPSILTGVQEALETPRVSFCSPFGIHVCGEEGA